MFAGFQPVSLTLQVSLGVHSDWTEVASLPPETTQVYYDLGFTSLSIANLIYKTNP